MEWGLVERMEHERNSLNEFANVLRQKSANFEVFALNLELRSGLIGIWQSEIIRIARENETLKRQLREATHVKEKTQWK